MRTPTPQLHTAQGHRLFQSRVGPAQFEHRPTIRIVENCWWAGGLCTNNVGWAPPTTIVGGMVGSAHPTGSARPDYLCKAGPARRSVAGPTLHPAQLQKSIGNSTQPVPFALPRSGQRRGRRNTASRSMTPRSLSAYEVVKFAERCLPLSGARFGDERLQLAECPVRKFARRMQFINSRGTTIEQVDTARRDRRVEGVHRFQRFFVRADLRRTTATDQRQSQTQRGGGCRESPANDSVV